MSCRLKRTVCKSSSRSQYILTLYCMCNWSAVNAQRLPAPKITPALASKTRRLFTHTMNGLDNFDRRSWYGVVHLNQSKQLRETKSRDTKCPFTMSYRSKYSDGTSRSTQPAVDFTSPGLAVMEVERLLISGKAIITNADEVWPNLYIGNM